MAEKLPGLKYKDVVVSDDSSEDGQSDDAAVDLGISLEKLNLGPRKKLLVLCLGGLLLERVHKRDRARVQSYRPHGVYGNFLLFNRPFCEDFLKFCFERFEVGLWSSAMEHNMDAAISSIMGGYRRRLLFSWDQEECTDSGFGCLEKKQKPLFLKELKHLWEKKYQSLPWQKGQYSSLNTLLIDDSPHVALLNPPNTAIFPEKYTVGSSEDTFLGPKGDLRVYLEGLADAADVPSYVKENPFGQPAINPSHPDWDYYAKIVLPFRREDAESTKK